MDDEEDFCYFVKLNLEETEHYEVLTTYDGPEGIDMAIRYHPDMILLDIIMPKMMGTEVAEVLRSNKATKDIPILFVTAILKREEVGGKGRKSGGNIFLFISQSPCLTWSKKSGLRSGRVLPVCSVK